MNTNELRVRRLFNYFFGAFSLIHLYGAAKTYMMIGVTGTAHVLAFWLIAGATVYAVALYVNNKGAINLAILLFIVEQGIHQFILVKYLGLNLGFQSFYLIGPVLLFFTTYRLPVKALITITIFIAYCSLTLGF